MEFEAVKLKTCLRVRLLEIEQQTGYVRQVALSFEAPIL
jgi:hypothetical protein